MAAMSIRLLLCLQLASLPGCVDADTLREFGLSAGYWTHLPLEQQLRATWPMRRRLVACVRRILLAYRECAHPPAAICTCLSIAPAGHVSTAALILALMPAPFIPHMARSELAWADAAVPAQSALLNAARR